MRDPQQWYWELKAKLFATQRRKEKMEEDFAKAFREIKESVNPVDYESIVVAQDYYEHFSGKHEDSKRYHESRIENITKQLDELNQEHGPLKEFHPSLIDAIFTSDIPPLWPDHKTMQ